MGEDDGVGLRVFLLSRAVTLGDFGGTARPTLIQVPHMVVAFGHGGAFRPSWWCHVRPVE